MPEKIPKASDSHTTQPGLTEPPHQVQKQQKEMGESKYTADHQRCGGQGSAAADQAKCPNGIQRAASAKSLPRQLANFVLVSVPRDLKTRKPVNIQG